MGRQFAKVQSELWRVVVQSACGKDETCQWDGLQCSLACEARHNTEVACVSDPSCQWDSKHGNCAQRCSTVVSSTQCEAAPLCEIGPNGKCRDTCEAQHVSVASCSADARCAWDSINLVCQTKCAEIHSMDGTDCVSNAKCMFDFVAKTCAPTCSETAGCPTSTCVTNTYGNCVFNCQARLNLTQCTQNSACMVSGGNCVPNCKEQYGSRSAECASDRLCQWNGATSTCEATCDRVSLAQCADKSSCMVVNGTCKASCGKHHSTYVECSADSDCIWDITNNYCKRSCTSIGTSVACNSNNECQWIGRLNVCARRCSIKAPAECAESSQCTLLNGTCQEKCLYRYGTQVDCINDASCEWYASSGTCGQVRCKANNVFSCSEDLICVWNSTSKKCSRAPCQWFDVVSCSADSHCEWYLANNTCLQAQCRSSVESDCRSSSQCKWDGKCIKACSLLGTKQECLASSCDWTFAGVCAEVCRMRYTNEVDCRADPNCQWDFSENVCSPSCSKLSSPQQCATNYLCSWVGQYCKSSCSTKYTTNNLMQCKDDPECELVIRVYEVVDGHERITYACEEPCSRMNVTVCKENPSCKTSTQQSCETGCFAKYGSEAACAANPSCVWTTTGCAETCDGMEQPECVASPQKCTWTNNSCLTLCAVSRKTEAACRGDGTCLWVNGACTEGCERYTAQACPTSFCVVEKTVCMRSCSLRYSANSSCDRDSSCEWNYSTSKCQPRSCTGSSQASCGSGCLWVNSSCTKPCTAFSLAVSCANDLRCEWSSSQQTCYPKCSTLPTTADCLRIPSCFVADGTCVPQCSVHSSEAECAAGSASCTWDDTTKQCRKQCQYRYDNDPTGVQCTSDADCMYYNGKCTMKRCAYVTAAICQSDTECTWNATSQQCRMRDCSFSTEGACEAAGCRWSLSVEGAKCVTSPCSSTLSPQQCQSHPECTFNASCGTKACYATTQAVCVMSNRCQWNAAAAQCETASKDCVYSNWSSWGECSLPCEGGVQVRTREILRPASDGGAPCTAALEESRNCNSGIVCDCASILMPAMCARILKCQWIHGRCVTAPHNETPCDELTPQAVCEADPRCVWIDDHCLVGMLSTTQHARFKLLSSETCKEGWTYVDPSLTSDKAYTPMHSVIVFDHVKVDPTMPSVDCAVVSIEDGYSRGMDRLSAKPTGANISIQWQKDRGVLLLEGNAAPGAYAEIISQVTFLTTSQSTAGRAITWNLGCRTFASTTQRRLFRFFPTPKPVTWWSAKAACEASTHLGVAGYLASVVSQVESNILSNKLLVEGWIAGSDATVPGEWRWASGPLSTQKNATAQLFWLGKGVAAGGKAAAFAHWELPGLTTALGEPNNLPGDQFALVMINGYWADRPNQDPSVKGYVCEYGDDSNNKIPNTIYGKSILRWMGCVPTGDSIAKACSGRTSLDYCSATPECTWDTKVLRCLPGCRYISNRAQCSDTSYCHLDLDSVPALCEANTCANTSCTDPRCTRDGSECVYNVGCSRFSDPPSCTSDYRCEWSSSGCSRKDTCRAYQSSDQCVAESCQASCNADATCELVSSKANSVCISRQCNVATSQCPTQYCQVLSHGGQIHSSQAGHQSLSSAVRQMCPAPMVSPFRSRKGSRRVTNSYLLQTAMMTSPQAGTASVAS